MQNRVNVEFYKNNKNDKIWWVNEYELDNGIISPIRGHLKFSFDKKKIYNAWTDYPNSLTEKEKKIFDDENPYWKDFFSNR